MTSKPLPSPELLRKLLRHEPDTGELFWRKRPVEFFTDGKHAAQHNADKWNNRYAGKEALTNDDGKGYWKGCIFGRTYKAHRVIWAMVHGEWPSDQIDHINGVRGDNRIQNLRVVTNQENGRNQKRPCDNTSGVTGVHWHTRRSKWVARIKADGRYRHLGYFDDFDEAVGVRKSAEIEHGYHPNHGR